MNKKTQNILNLTQLWKEVTNASANQFKNNVFETAIIPNTEWPNRIWSNNNSITTKDIANLKDSLGPLYSKLTLSLFCSADDSIKQLTQLKSTQYGMSLVLAKKFPVQKELEFNKVSNTGAAELWSQIFANAFGYEIHPETILSASKELDFYLVNFQGDHVGTLILYDTDNIVGIHSLGIKSEKRNQGFATEIMRKALNQSIDKGLNLATLQASEMAKNMYLKLGFTIDFLMNNYQIK